MIDVYSINIITWCGGIIYVAVLSPTSSSPSPKDPYELRYQSVTCSTNATQCRLNGTMFGMLGAAILAPRLGGLWTQAASSQFHGLSNKALNNEPGRTKTPGKP
eukprot:4752909-Amphidinium_carterae.1